MGVKGTYRNIGSSKPYAATVISAIQRRWKNVIKKREFDIVITPESRGGSSVLSEMIRYRDLIFLMVRRDFISNYKQTVLGPAWAIVQPMVSTIITAFVFGGLAGLSPSGIPVFLFYMIGQIFWNFFSSCLTGSSNTFLNHVNLLSKIYFPRFVMPITDGLSRLLSLLIQIILFIVFYIGYLISGAPLRLHWTAILIPLYIVHLAALGIGVGSILSAFTTKYRDTVFLMGYISTFWMYVTPIVYDISIIPDKYLFLYMMNPATPIINHIRYAVFNQGMLNWGYYFISLAVSAVILAAGYKVFNRVERTFVDTI